MIALSSKVLSAPFRADLDRIIGAHNKNAYSADKRVMRECSSKTRHDRRGEIFRAFADLHQLGYHLQDPRSFKNKHLQALANSWEERGLSPRTIHTRFSILTVFCTWIGKPNVPGNITDYFTSPDVIKRTTVTTVNKEWGSKGVNVNEILEKATKLNERFGLYLALQHYFGLRVKESIEMQPKRAIPMDGSRHLIVSDGTKGGFCRAIPIRTEEQRKTLEWALRLAQEHRNIRLRWPDRTWEQARSRFYNFMKKLGITKVDLGVTAHGLRHGFAQNSYHFLTGQPTPIEGGAIGRICYDAHTDASLMVSSWLGHHRKEVVSAYYGSYGHILRPSKVTVTWAPLLRNQLPIRAVRFY